MDYIIKPCDWETIYLAKEKDANKFGEALRNFCFKGNCETTGCYSTFEMIDLFKKVKEGHPIYEEAKRNIWNDEVKPTVYYYKLEEKDCYINYILDGKVEKMKVCDPTEIVVGWAWDGDGCLYIRWNNRIVRNDDCKKDYVWEWINYGT